MRHAYASCTCNLISTCTVYMHKLIVSTKEPHYSDEPLHFTNASLQYSKNKNAWPDQVVYHACSLPPFASSYHRLLEQKVPAGYNGHMHEMCLHPPHICSNICMTMGLHACQYCTSTHIQSDFDQHNITHSTA